MHIAHGRLQQLYNKSSGTVKKLSHLRMIHTSNRSSPEQRVLSPVFGYNPEATASYEFVFADVSAVKASYVRLGIDT